MNKSKTFSPEVRERAVRVLLAQRSKYLSLWSTVESIALKISCVPQTLSTWVKQREIDVGVRDGTTTAEVRRVEELEREVKKLHWVDGILNLDSAFFVRAEFDRRLKS